METAITSSIDEQGILHAYSTWVCSNKRGKQNMMGRAEGKIRL
jgi:hypothetical protein